MDTVLIVDDSSFIVEGLIAFLKKKYIPLAAYGGGECLEILKREIPSVIILDIMMEPMDGWETLSLIREDPRTRHIPVIMFSAVKISMADAEKHRISIDDCLTKPVSPKKIFEAIEKVLVRRDTNRVVVDRWQSAGISQEKIDLYLSLTASLEVDLSLCQNMTIQYDLEHPRDKNLDEFDRVIAAIRDRILMERDQIGTLAREMNEVIDQEIGKKLPAGTQSPAVADDGSPDENSISVTASDSLRPGLSEEMNKQIQEPVTVDAVGPAKGYGLVPEEVSATGILSPPNGVMDQPDSEPPCLKSGPDPEVSASGPGESDAPSHEMIVTPAVCENPAASPMSATGAGAGGSQHGMENTGQSGNSGENGMIPQAPPSGSTPATTTAPDFPSFEIRNVIPANPDIPRHRSGTQSVDGAGTDVPMPWNSVRERNPRSLISELRKRLKSPVQEPVSDSPGFFTRIKLLVRSLFSKKK